MRNSSIVPRPEASARPPVRLRIRTHSSRSHCRLIKTTSSSPEKWAAADQTANRSYLGNHGRRLQRPHCGQRRTQPWPWRAGRATEPWFDAGAALETSEADGSTPILVAVKYAPAGTCGHVVGRRWGLGSEGHDSPACGGAALYSTVAFTMEEEAVIRTAADVALAAQLLPL